MRQAFALLRPLTGFTRAAGAAKFPLMNLNAVRLSGIAASTLLIAACLYLGVTAPAAPASTLEAAPARAPIVIGLRGDGPLARAQRLARQGAAEAEERARAAIARQRDFGGLCFAGFTERQDIILRACGPGPARAVLIARLRAMDAITYVDAEGD